MPRPINRPVEIWQPIASGRTLRVHRDARHQGHGDAERLEDHRAGAKAYRESRQGRPAAPARRGSGARPGPVHRRQQEEAIRRVEPYHDERYKWFAPFGFVRYADEQGRTWGTPGAPARLPTLRDGVQQKAWLCGPPSEIVAELKATRRRIPAWIRC